MKRVMIVGGPGSGKSTMARWIGALTKLPIQHMDHIHWLPNWVERTTEQKLPLITAVEAQDSWIIEGGISVRYAARLARADMLVWLDLPVGLRLWRVAKRSIKGRGKTRPDLPEGCVERLDKGAAEFLVWTWRNRNSSRQKILETIEQHSGGAVIHHLQSRREVREFMMAFEIRNE